jgi:DNA-damage-inducible protein J
MVKNSTIQIRVDEDLKKKADSLFTELGIDTASAIRLFLTQAVMRNEIPFEIKIIEDPFYNSYNQNRIKRSIEKAEKGLYTKHKLVEVDNE